MSDYTLQQILNELRTVNSNLVAMKAAIKSVEEAVWQTGPEA